MIELELGAPLVGNTTLAFSPLGEIGCSLAMLMRSPPPTHHHWARAVLPQMRRVNAELLQSLVPGGRWMPSFLVPAVVAAQPSLEDQLEVIAGMSAEAIGSDLVESWPERPPPALQRLLGAGDHAGPQLASELSLYWNMAIAPWWPRIRGVLEDDVLYRVARSMNQGIYAIFADMHPRVEVGAGALHLDMPGHNHATYHGSRLVLIPSAFVWPGLILNHDNPAAFCLTYGARGLGRIWESDQGRSSRTSQPLTALLGRTRARVLAALDVPTTTSELALQLGQTSPSVSRHLAVLRDSGLAQSWRAGRKVLYRQTQLGRSLVLATDHSEPGLTGDT